MDRLLRHRRTLVLLAPCRQTGDRCVNGGDAPEDTPEDAPEDGHVTVLPVCPLDVVHGCSSVSSRLCGAEDGQGDNIYLLSLIS